MVSHRIVWFNYQQLDLLLWFTGKKTQVKKERSHGMDTSITPYTIKSAAKNIKLSTQLCHSSICACKAHWAKWNDMILMWRIQTHIWKPRMPIKSSSNEYRFLRCEISDWTIINIAVIWGRRWFTPQVMTNLLQPINFYFGKDLYSC